MNIPQTTYNANPAKAIEGMLVDTALANFVVSKFVAVADAPIKAGRMLARSTSVAGQADVNVKLPAAGADVTTHIQGISLYDASKGPGAYGAPLYNGQTMPSAIPCLRRGRVWVLPEVDVVIDDPVFARITVNGGLDQLGAFRNDADGGNATAVPTGKFVTSGTAGTPVQVEINLP